MGLSYAAPEMEIEKDTLAWRKRFISDHKCWTSIQIAAESGSTARNRYELASRWSREHKTFAVRYERDLLYPRFQFQDGSPIPAVSRVIKEFPAHATGWDLAFFFTSPNSYIGGRKPLELLKEDPERLVALARSFANPANAF